MRTSIFVMYAYAIHDVIRLGITCIRYAVLLYAYCTDMFSIISYQHDNDGDAILSYVWRDASKSLQVSPWEWGTTDATLFQTGSFKLDR